jgi:branched-chain amino acid transport system substrate-binding protein
MPVTPGRATLLVGRRRFRRSPSWALIAIALALVAAACSSSSKTSSSGSSTSKAPTTSAVSGTPYVIGSISDVTGAEASSEGTTNRSLQAWAAWANANGGINGHPVKLYTLDTQFNPANALSDIKQLVEQDHIIALVGEQTSFDAVFTSYLQQRGIPVVGEGLYTPASYSNPDFFPEGTTSIPSTYNEIHLGVAKGFSKYAFLYCAESPACSEAIPVQKALASIAGATLSYSASVSASAPNYAAQCLAAKGAGVQFMAIGDNASTILRVADSCATQGYTPLQVGTDGSVTTTWSSSQSMQGALAVQQDAPFSDTSNPAVKTMIDAYQKYDSGILTSDSWGENDVYSWASGQLFAAAAKAGNLGDSPTSAGVIKGLYALNGETLGGLAPPLTYTNDGKGHQIYCNFVMGVQNKQFTMPQGETLSCAPQSPLVGIITKVTAS